ncbi:translocation/assembly module TamB domain-containing protein [soil metagenome]
MWIFISIFALIIIVIVALQIPATQNFITGKAINFLEERIGTRVELAEINIGFPKSIVIRDFYMEDQSQDTLLYAHRLAVNVDMFGFLRQEIQINSIELERMTAHVYRTLPDSTFNFDYIIDAFASEEEQSEDTTESAWDISLYELGLQDIYLTYRDEVTGNDVNLRLGEFELEMDEFDLNQNIFHVGLIALNDTRLRVIQSKEPPEEEVIDESPDEEAPDTFDYDVALNRFTMNNVDLDYQNLVSAQQLLFNIGEFQIRGDEINLPGQVINLKSISLHNSDLQIVLNENVVADSIAKDVEKTISEKEGEEDGTSLAFLLNELNLSGNRIRFNNYNEPQQPTGLDFNHLDLDSLKIIVRNFEFDEELIKANIQQFAFHEQSGFRLEEVTANIEIDSTEARVGDFVIRTGHSRFQNNIEARYPSLATINENIGQIILALNIDAEIGFRDIAYLQPELASDPPIASNLNESVAFNARLSGPVSNLNIQNFTASALNATSLSMRGNVRGLPETENLYLNINLENFSSTRSDLLEVMPPGTLPEGFNLPATINLVANFTGTMEDFRTTANLNTSAGDISTNLTMRSVQGLETYQGNLAIQDLDLGFLMGQPDTLGLLSLEANIDGSGLTPEEIRAELNAVIHKAEYMQYQYNNLVIDGTFEQQQFTGQANINDENLRFAFDGNVNLNEEERPVIDFIFNLEHANLQALNLVEEPFTAEFKLEADMSGSDLNDINGTFGIRDVTIVRAGDRYSVNSLLVGSIQEKRNTEITIDSEIFSASLTGTVNLGDLAPTITRHLNRYFDLHDDEIEDDLEPQNFDFDIVVHNTDLITDVLIPDLHRFIPGLIHGSYNSENMNLELNIEFPQIVYGTTVIDDLQFNVDSDRNQLNYAFTVAQILDSSFHIINMGLLGEVENNLINTRFHLLDEEENERFLLGGVLESLENVFRFRFQPDQIILNYEEWIVPEDNYLEFGEESIVANNIAFQRDGQQFSINTLPDENLEVAFQNFNLVIFSRMFEREENMITGLLEGNVVLDQQQEAFAFTADLDIMNFSYLGDTLGNISLLAGNPQANQYDVNLEITGFGNQLNIVGNYIIPEEEEAPGIIDFDINLENLNLASVQAYASGQLENMTGSLRGNLTATGTTDDPQVRGQLSFQEASFLLTMLNNQFRLEDEQIIFDDQGIQFPNFQMIDPNNNLATINGTIYTQTYTDFEFDLDVTSRNFRFINTTAEDNAEYYGNLILDTNLEITGNLDLPEIQGSLTVKDGTDMTYAIPAGEAGIAEMEGIVEFVDMSLDDPFAASDTLKTRAELQGINLSMIVRTEKEARFNVLMDPSGTDALAIRGAADLNLGISPAGDITLTGRYEIAEGSYQLAFMGVVNRRFDINPGSTIIWSGDIMDATLDIRAIYNVRTSPLNLLQGRLEGDAPPQSRQQFPFMVYLNMKGELMNPLISFGLDMPEEHRGAVGGTIFPIIQELNQEQQVAELNKQVFALLVLNSFIAQDPLAGGAGGGGIEGAARRSVSNLLTQQLNKLADRYITGFDLNIGVESYDDFDTGEAAGRTELQVGVSRQFLDNRVTVQVGGNIDVEGDRARQQKGISDIAGNVAVEYNLTEDGRYRLRGFREQTFESIIDGQLIETGLGLIFTRDYNRLRDLFRKTRRERELENKANGIESLRKEDDESAIENR